MKPATKYFVDGECVFARSPEEAKKVAARLKELFKSSQNMLKNEPANIRQTLT